MDMLRMDIARHFGCVLPTFLTPVGITLFPIFENSLCGKELAVKTPNLKRNKPGHLFYVQNV